MSYCIHFRKKVLAKLEEGYSIREISAQFEIDKMTVVSWKKRLERKTTHPRAPTEIDNQALRDNVEKYPLAK